MFNESDGELTSLRVGTLSDVAAAEVVTAWKST